MAPWNRFMNRRCPPNVMRCGFGEVLRCYVTKNSEQWLLWLSPGDSLVNHNNPPKPTPCPLSGKWRRSPPPARAPHEAPTRNPDNRVDLRQPPFSGKNPPGLQSPKVVEHHTPLTQRRGRAQLQCDLSREITPCLRECKCTRHLHVPGNAQDISIGPGTCGHARCARHRHPSRTPRKTATRPPEAGRLRLPRAKAPRQGCELPHTPVPAHHLTWGDRVRVRCHHLPTRPDADHT